MARSMAWKCESRKVFFFTFAPVSTRPLFHVFRFSHGDISLPLCCVRKQNLIRKIEFSAPRTKVYVRPRPSREKESLFSSGTCGFLKHLLLLHPFRNSIHFSCYFLSLATDHTWFWLSEKRVFGAPFLATVLAFLSFPPPFSVFLSLSLGFCCKPKHLFWGSDSTLAAPNWLPTLLFALQRIRKIIMHSVLRTNQFHFIL